MTDIIRDKLLPPSCSMWKTVVWCWARPVIGLCFGLQIQRTDGQWYWAEYSTFSISDEASKYRLTVSGYSGNAGDAMTRAQHAYWNANGMKFSTPDSDNDNFVDDDYSCAASWGAGWWFNRCSVSMLNTKIDTDYSSWDTNPGSNVQASRMLIKVTGMIGSRIFQRFSAVDRQIVRRKLDIFLFLNKHIRFVSIS